jgi:hypothetical protein
MAENKSSTETRISEQRTGSGSSGEYRLPQSVDFRPIPDPTILTTQQLLREIASVREILESRLNGMDRAIDLLQSQVDKSPSIGEMYAKHEEKFHSIQTQFSERDTRTDQTSKDSKVAVDAALQAAKEAVGEQNKSSALAIAKSEASTTKQIDQISVIINSLAKGMDDKIDDIKTRITSMEGHTRGIGDGWGYLVGVIGILSAAASLITLLIKFH